MKLQELKQAIHELSFEERAELNRLLNDWEDDAWDKQMTENVKAGRLNDIINRAEADMEAGRYRKLS